jgi:hypothetical protein
VNLRRDRLSAICQPTGSLALGDTPKDSKIGCESGRGDWIRTSDPCAQVWLRL